LRAAFLPSMDLEPSWPGLGVRDGAILCYSLPREPAVRKFKGVGYIESGRLTGMAFSGSKAVRCKAWVGQRIHFAVCTHLSLSA
jgi:hypothetical protein